MLEFVETGKDLLLGYIHMAFKDDEKLRTEFHIAPSEMFQDCVAHSFNRISELIDLSPTHVDLYGIKSGDEKVGFVVLQKEGNILYSFGLSINHRNAENKEDLINFVKKELGDKSVVYLYSKNKRAIGFMKKNGFIEKEFLVDNTEPITVLECQLQQPS